MGKKMGVSKKILYTLSVLFEVIYDSEDPAYCRLAAAAEDDMEGPGERARARSYFSSRQVQKTG